MRPDAHANGRRIFSAGRRGVPIGWLITGAAVWFTATSVPLVWRAAWATEALHERAGAGTLVAFTAAVFAFNAILLAIVAGRLSPRHTEVREAAFRRAFGVLSLVRMRAETRQASLALADGCARLVPRSSNYTGGDRVRRAAIHPPVCGSPVVRGRFAFPFRPTGHRVENRGHRP
ncbi:hypothetical protein [Thermomonas hydrothermalis]|uniref:Uncharacterized protein n=1 Tax=Thermomonas hydrothermalis TaxID=213588 RepID=A0A1M4YV85_9GAMM|nr:hypothetical protein [Thermomonas hydrothermalis]SHF09660.1 hypothetical protein SAMN02745204_01783 [Thermomonas hydrothermalis]